MVDDLDNLLLDLDIEVNSIARSDLSQARNSQRTTNKRSNLHEDIQDILTLDFNEPKVQTLEKPDLIKQEIIKCYPVFIAGKNVSIGWSNLGSAKICSSLHCRNCDLKVSRFPDFIWMYNADYIFLRTNMPSFEKICKKLKRKKGFIAYACHCVSYSTDKLQALHMLDSLPWFCKGHAV